MFAKGRNHLEAEIDFMYDAYKGLIERVKMVYAKDLEDIRKSIESISSDASLDDEEKRTQIFPFLHVEIDIQSEELHSRVAIFTSIFSFWEKSLLQICNFYGKIVKKDGCENPTPQIKDYLEALLNNTDIQQLPETLISQLEELNKLKELRNYCTHGTKPEQRKRTIKELITSDSFDIVEIDDKYFFYSYEGLLKVLEIIKDTTKKIQSNLESTQQ